MNANIKARRLFKRMHNPQYIPHLSLMYGIFSREEKEKIISKDLPRLEPILNYSRSLDLKFKISSIHLFSNEGKVEDWCRVREFSLE